FLRDLQAADDYALERYSAPFAGLEPEQQDAIITLAEQQQLDGADDTFFAAIKQLTVTGYYTSEIGMTVERVYLPVPGRYDGAYPYADGDRLFSG
ncbi:MAG: gluconate 2-dehydrogenase subunit 3 family protein, partial [Rhodospirillaceae bacterium]|nr:gluconate 2-dehydrogenase subunit 3 family protein [Rhodospirillaceae bacterium]